ncbi:MAG: hypothetical protein RI935_696 [Candidatus Parcubacteria bacterium]|jgi:hypothetical protein
MRASNFKQFKKGLQRQIVDFSIEADRNVGDDEFEPPIYRHSAAEILVWILDRKGVALRNHQLVEAWRSIVTKCWNLMDFTSFGENDASCILSEINHRMERSTHKVTSDTNGHTVVVPRVTRIRRAATA